MTPAENEATPPSNPNISTRRRGKKFMNDYVWILLLIAWLVLLKLVLPRLGVPT
jgi:p-aminobenzoyl-glutamate transporter AbgT